MSISRSCACVGCHVPDPSFLLNELEDARLDNEQQDELEQEVKELEHAEEIKFKLTSALQSLTESEYCATGALKEFGAKSQCWLGVPLFSDDEVVGAEVLARHLHLELSYER